MHVSEFEIALQDNDYSAIENIWLSIIENHPEDAELFLKLAEKLAQRGERRRAATLLQLTLEPLSSAEKYHDAFRILQVAAEYHPKEKKLWDDLMTVVPLAFADFPEIEKILEEGREQYAGKVEGFLNHVNSFTFFKPGDWVKHEKGWGIGKVSAVEPSNRKLVVDFLDKPGHRFALEAAGKMLDKLDRDSLDVWKVERLEELQQLAKDKPLEVIKIALRPERTQELTQREIKARLVPSVMDQKTWSKFLTAVKKAAQKDEYVRLGNGQNPTFKLLDSAVTFEEAATERFSTPGTWEEKLERARDIITQVADHGYDPNPVVPAIAAYFQKQVEQDEDREHAFGLAGIFVLREIDARIGGTKVDGFPASILSPQAYFDVAEPKRYIDLLTRINVARYQREGLQLVATFAPQSWVETLRQALLSEASAMWDEALAQCEKTGHMQVYEEVGQEVTIDPMIAPDTFLWYVRQTYNRTPEGENTEELYHLFDKVLTLASRLNHAHSRGDKTAKPSLQKLKNLLSEDRNALLRRILHDLTPDKATHLYKHIESCTALGNNLPPKLRRMIRKEHKDVEQPVTEMAYQIDAAITVTTLEGLQKQQRLAKQLKDEIDENAKAIGAAIEMGDVSENAELDAAREKEARLKGRLSEVQKQLSNVLVLEPESIDTDRVVPGTRVTFRDEERDDPETVTILGPWDADHERGIMSYRAPMAEAMLGAHAGDVIVLAAQGNRRIRIEKIENALLEMAEKK